MYQSIVRTYRQSKTVRTHTHSHSAGDTGALCRTFDGVIILNQAAAWILGVLAPQADRDGFGVSWLTAGARVDQSITRAARRGV